MRITAIVACVLLACASVAQYPFTQTHEIKSLAKRVHLNSIEQDQKGLIWMGTDEGLIYFNGERAQTINEDRSPVLATTTSNGAVIAALANGTIVRCNGLQMDTLLSDTNQVGKDVRCVLLDHNGAIWIGRYNSGVLVIEDGTAHVISTANGLRDDHIHAMVLLPNGNVALASDQGVAIVERSSDGKYKITSVEGLPDNLVTSLALNGDTIWVGTQSRGICRIILPSITVQTFPVMSEWTFGSVQGIEVGHNELWVGTQHQGVVRVWLGKQLGYNAPDAAANGAGKTTKDIYLDANGGLWSCYGDEWLQRSETAVQLIRRHEDVDLDHLSALCAGPNSTFYAAKGRVLIKHAMQFNNLNSMDVFPDLGLPSDVVSLHMDASGKLWIGTFGGGIMVLNSDGTTATFNSGNGLCDDHVLGIGSTRTHIWFATLGGVCRTPMNHGTPRHFERMNIPGSGFIYDVIGMDNGTVHIATDGAGVITLNAQGAVSQQLAERAHRTFYSLSIGNDGGAWAIGPNTGICRIGGDSAVCFGAGSTALNDVYGVEMVQGLVVAITKNGLVTLDPATGRLTELFGSFGIGELSAELNAMFADDQGRLWVGSDDGLYNIGLVDRLLQGQMETSVLGVMQGDVLLTEQQLSDLKSDQDFLTFHLHGKAYSASGSLRFIYQLVGFDGAKMVTRDRSVSYSKLPPGDYTFTAQATLGENAAMGTIVAIPIHIRPPFWQNWWFILLVAMLIGFGAFMFIRARDARRERRQRAERDVMRFQFEALSSQVNPHFLFNSFNTLIELIEESKDKAIDHVQDLSDMFRSMLKVRDKEVISLREDLDLLNTYVQLEKRRFGDRIIMEQEVDPDQLGFGVAPLTTQLLVENAIKHTVFTKDEPLKVTLSAHNGSITVRNAHRPKESTVNSTGYGLESIRQRYSMFHDRPMTAGVVGNEFVVTIPLIPPS